MNKFLSFFVVVLALSFIQNSGLAVFAAEKTTTWRAATFGTKKRLEWNQLEFHKKNVFEKSKGQLNVVLYPGLSLGINPFDALRALKKGRIEMAAVFGAVAVRDEPLYGILAPQGVWNDPSDVLKWRGPLKKIKAEIYKKWGIISGYDIFIAIDWIYVFTKKPVKSLDDLKGMKIRVWKPDLVKTLAKLVITGQMIHRGDLYLAMKTGVVDGCLSAPSLIKALSIQEVAKYAVPIFVHTSELGDMGISKIAYDKLPVESKKALRDVVPIAYEYGINHYYGHEPIAPFIEDLKKDGMIFNPAFSEADRLRIKKAAFEVWETTARKLGPKGMEYYKILKATLE